MENQSSQWRDDPKNGLWEFRSHNFNVTISRIKTSGILPIRYRVVINGEHIGSFMTLENAKSAVIRLAA